MVVVCTLYLLRINRNVLVIQDLAVLLVKFVLPIFRLLFLNWLMVPTLLVLGLVIQNSQIISP